MRSGKHNDLVVVGGGIIGLAVAREAALRGLRVTVLDRGRPGAGASGAAAGMLSPLAESSETGPFLDAGLASLALYPAWVAALEAESGTPVWFRPDGKLRVAFTPDQVERLEGLARRARSMGLACRWVEPLEVDTQLGARCAPVLAALHLEQDFQVDPRRLHRALLESALGRGVTVRDHTEVTGLLEGVEGVVTRDGSEIRGRAVLLAAGAWSGSLGPTTALPVRPVRGQMLALKAGPHLPACVVESESVYLVPRQDGRLLVGATVEEAGFSAACTPEARQALHEAASRVLPGLAQAPVLEHWAGLRPGTPDGHPILGEVPGWRGLLVATGHYRNGILLAPWTAQALARLVEGRTEGPEIPGSFRPDRFLEGPRTAPAPEGAAVAPSGGRR